MQPDDSSINQRHEKGIKIFDTLGIDCKKAKFKNHSRQLLTGDIGKSLPNHVLIWSNYESWNFESTIIKN